MSTPVDERPPPRMHDDNHNDDISPLSDDDTNINSASDNGNNLRIDPSLEPDTAPARSPSVAREQRMRFQDDLAVLEAERVASRSIHEDNEEGDRKSTTSHTSRRSHHHVDEFEMATNPLHEKAALFNPPEDPTTNFAKFIKKLHSSSFILRYLTYILPVVVILLIPLLLGALRFPNATVGGVSLLWFSIWLEIFWLTLWAGRIVAKCIPGPLGIVASVFTNNAKKWRDVAEQLELPATLFFWFLGVEVSFLPTMKNHHITPPYDTRDWEDTFNKIIISVFVWTIVNLIEKFIIQLIAMSFHMRTYADRIEINKFQIGSLAKLYAFSTTKITDRDEDFEERNDSGGSGGMKTPLKYAKQAQKSAKGALNKVGDVAGTVAADFAGRQAKNSTHPHSVVLTLLRTTSGSQVLARRLYRTFVRDGFDTVFASDLKEAFDNDEEAEAAFAMFDKDLNGDISMEELESVCMEVGRDRKSITASLKDLDSVVGRLDGVLSFFVLVIVLLVFLSLISASAAGVLTSAGSTILALSWLFSATGQEFLQSVVFVFIKHPFDVGDRVTIYGFTGDNGLGDDYYVKSIALLYTEFKKMQGHIVQAPNSYLNTLFILNVRRSGSLAEVIPIVVKFGTTLDQIDLLRMRLLEFVRSEKREYQTNILTEMREVTENYSISINVIFFYKTNIQNELLRLIRRNKFVCMLSIALQELGIEGPRVNLPGANVNFPFNLNSTGPSQATGTLAPPSGDEGPAPATRVSSDSGALAEDSGATSSARHPSILRKGSDAAAMRARGAATSRKHVDFSSTVREMTGEDMVGDVFEDRDNTSGVSSIVRESNREAAMRRVQEREEEEERRSQSSPAPGRSSNLTVPEREGRRSGESHSRRSISSSIHRNRFFRHRSSVSREREDVEKGK